MALPDMEPFRIERSDQVKSWQETLGPKQRVMLETGIEMLADHGPALAGGKVRRIKSSRYHNMKELRVNNHSIRVLFAFDLNRRAVLLVGGDKRGEWNRWYPRKVRQADATFAAHLRSTGQEERWRQTRRRDRER